MNTREVLQDIFHAALREIDPQNLISSNCGIEGNIFSVLGQRYDLSKYERVIVLGTGKAAWSMAKSLEDMLGDIVHSGLVVAPACKGGLKNIECLEADHPIPTQRSLEAGRGLIRKVSECGSKDLFIYLLSGGSSALIESPVEGISLADMQVATSIMLRNSLRIDEINTVRKHLSGIKGGRLGEYGKAEGIVLTISDVIDDDLYSIGSAPLYADVSTYGDTMDILKSHDLWEQVPQSVRSVLEEGLDGQRPETPKKPSDRIRHFIVGSNVVARKAAWKRAGELGFDALLVMEDIASDVHEASGKMLDIALSAKQKVIVFGGETTVKVLGGGKGGRNQHGALNMLRLSQEKGLEVAFLSAGTDGIDGNSNAAGAFFDSKALQQAKKMGLNPDIYLEENDSHHFFKQLDSLVMTGPTGCNVMDISILIKEF